MQYQKSFLTETQFQQIVSEVSSRKTPCVVALVASNVQIIPSNSMPAMELKKYKAPAYLAEFQGGENSKIIKNVLARRAVMPLIETKKHRQKTKETPLSISRVRLLSLLINNEGMLTTSEAFDLMVKEYGENNTEVRRNSVGRCLVDMLNTKPELIRKIGKKKVLCNVGKNNHMGEHYRDSPLYEITEFGRVQYQKYCYLLS